MNELFLVATYALVFSLVVAMLIISIDNHWI
jgi:hypothetical protein